MSVPVQFHSLQMCIQKRETIKGIETRWLMNISLCWRKNKEADEKKKDFPQCPRITRLFSLMNFRLFTHASVSFISWLSFCTVIISRIWRFLFQLLGLKFNVRLKKACVDLINMTQVVLICDPV